MKSQPRGEAPLIVPTPLSGADEKSTGTPSLSVMEGLRSSCPVPRAWCQLPPPSEDVGEDRPGTRDGALAE